MSSEALGSGHRLGSGPSDLLARTAFAHELEAAPYLWTGMAMADLAHVLALDAAGLLPEADRRALLDGVLTLVDFDGLVLDPSVGDIYNNRDRMLRDRIGRAAGHVHAGRARREASTIAWQIACRERLLRLGIAVTELVSVGARVAEAHVATLMPDLTYLHRAHPTTLAHYLLGHLAPCARHLDRIDRALTLVDSSPAGSGSTNGSRLPIDRDLLADLLGFGTVMRHTRDAMWAPDMAIDIAHVCVQVMTSIDRLAEELQLWTTEGFAFAELADDQSRTSVVMPHKKNPYSLTFLRGAARHALGTVTGVTATQLTSSGQPDSRTFAYLDAPRLLDDTADCAQLMAAVLDSTTFDPEAMSSAASEGFTTSTELCDHLTLTAGVDNRTAHNAVGRAVRHALEHGRNRLEASDLRRAAEEVGLALDLDDDTIVRVLDPREAVAGRVTFGGAGATEVEAMITSLRAEAERARRTFDEHDSHDYEARLVQRARAAAPRKDAPPA